MIYICAFLSATQLFQANFVPNLEREQHLEAPLNCVRAQRLGLQRLGAFFG